MSLVTLVIALGNYFVTLLGSGPEFQDNMQWGHAWMLATILHELICLSYKGGSK